MDTETTRDERHNASNTPATKDAASATDWRSDPWPITTEPVGTQGASYYDPLRNGNQGTYGSTYSTLDTYQAPRRRTRPAWISVLLLAVAVLRLLSHLGGSSHASSSDTTYSSSLYSSYIVPGVNVCGPANVSLFPLGCSAGDTTVAAKSDAQLCYTTIDSATFASARVTFTVQRLDAKGKVTAHGTSTDAVGLGDSSSCTAVDDVIHNAKMPLSPGAYSVYVSADSADLGYTTFTLTGKAL